MEIAPPPHPRAQVRPCVILLFAIPTLGKSRLAERRCFRHIVEGAILKNCHECTPCRRQMHWFKLPQVAFFINYGFDGSNHFSCLFAQFTPLRASSVLGRASKSIYSPVENKCCRRMHQESTRFCANLQQVRGRSKAISWSR
ncbi:MAG: hypothetical protein ABSD20_20905, partial [Terriglobales bacterium]|jgi:hypothetical protein